MGGGSTGLRSEFRSALIVRCAEAVDEPFSLTAATLPRSGPWRTRRVNSSLIGVIVSGQPGKVGIKVRCVQNRRTYAASCTLECGCPLCVRSLSRVHNQLATRFTRSVAEDFVDAEPLLMECALLVDDDDSQVRYSNATTIAELGLGPAIVVPRVRYWVSCLRFTSGVWMFWLCG